MTNFRHTFILLLIAGITIYSCQKSEISYTQPDDQVPQLPDEVYDYATLELPQSTFVNGLALQNFDIEDINNQLIFVDPFPPMQQLDNNIATLGRVLFYDKKLSLNNTVSCGTCHHQEKSFADGLRVSKGFEGRTTSRNSMAIVNPIVMHNLFWDSRSKSLHDLSLRPVQNHIEMGMEDVQLLEKKLSNVTYYATLFEKAFGNKGITAERISTAISQFIASITSNRSRFDEALVNNFENYSDLEKIGFELFHSSKTMCSTCHSGGNFSAPDGPMDPYGGFGFGTQDLGGAANIGLELQYKDEGRDDGKFKIPTLRNIALTSPYMHDGRFNTLEEVVNHYSEGIKPHPHLDPKFRDSNGFVKQLHLNALEKKAIVAFLHTLTDTEMTTNPKWSDPFKR